MVKLMVWNATPPDVFAQTVYVNLVWLTVGVPEMTPFVNVNPF